MMNKRYDAFLSYNSSDKLRVAGIARWLRDEAKLEVWFDDWELVPGRPFQEDLEKALAASKSCVVFVGPDGLGPWQNEEMRAALDSQVSRNTHQVVPVLLPGSTRPHEESALPSFLRRRTWVRFHDLGDREETLRRLASGIRGIPPGPPSTDFSTALPCPFRGLEVFREEDKDFFFGREAAVERLIDYLSHQRFLAILGPSGSGKSSVVQAGLIPRLRADAALISLFTPRQCPLEELAFALHRLAPSGAPSEKLLARLSRSDEALHFISRELVDDTAKSRLVIVVDQFEEIFTQCSNESERRRFQALILTAVERPNGSTTVILTLRSDFIGKCAAYPDLNAWVTDHLVQVETLGEDELRSAVVKPAGLVGLDFEEGLVERILEGVRSASGDLPLMEHALLELYEQREGRRLTLGAYRNIGGIEGALVQRAESEFAKLDAAQREILRKMFVLRLVQPGEGTEDTRRRAAKEELLAIGGDMTAAEAVVNRWTNARLLTTRNDRGTDWVDVSHEALIRRWSKIRTWMAEDRETARLVGDLRRAAAAWEREARSSDYLFQGARLAQLEELLGSHAHDLTEQERQFVAAGVARRERQRQQGVRRARTVAIIAAGIVLVVSYLAFKWNSSEARASKMLIRNYWETAHDDRNHGRLLDSLHVNAEAITNDPTHGLKKNILTDIEYYQPNPSLSHVFDHDGPVNGATFNSTETYIITWSDDGTARLWNSERGEPIGSPLKHQGPVLGAMFNAAEDRILTWSEDGTARLWRTESGELMIPPLEHRSSVLGATLNMAEDQILTWSDDGTAQLWNAKSGEPIGRALQHQTSVLGAMFMLKESRILTWSSDSTAQLWNTATGEHIGPPLQHKSSVLGAAVNAAQTRILTWSFDNTARLWNAENGEPVGLPLTHEMSVNGASFSPTETLILTWSADGTARLWNVETSEPIGRPLKHQGPVLGATFDGTESRILTWSADGTARLWSADTCTPIGPPLKHQRWVSGAITSVAGNQILTWSGDGTAQLWNSETGEPIGPDLRHGDTVKGAVFDTTGARILTWSRDGSARLWEIAPNQSISLLVLKHEDSVKGAAFYAAETRILTWSEDGTARIWSAVTGQPIGRILRHQSPVLGARFNAAETQIVTWSDNGRAQFWDAATGKALGPELKHDTWISGAAFNNAETLILTWSGDGTARLWSSKTGQPIFRPLKHDGWVRGATFSASERRILTWSDDGTARLWSAETGESISEPLRHEDSIWGARFNAAEDSILTWSLDGTARLWNIGAFKPINILTLTHGDAVTGATFNLVETRILTWSDDGTTRLWDLKSGELIGPPMVNGSWVKGAAFNSGETRILTWGFDGSARLWNADTSEPIGPPMKHGDAVSGAKYNLAETQILTWSDDGTTRIWDVETGEPIGPPLRHASRINGATLSSRETRVLTWSADGTARLWEIGGDLDIPNDLFKLQTQTLTGTEFIPTTHLVRCIEPERWRRLMEDYERRARHHYRTCKFPYYNVWRRFHLEDAAKIR